MAAEKRESPQARRGGGSLDGVCSTTPCLEPAGSLAMPCPEGRIPVPVVTVPVWCWGRLLPSPGGVMSPCPRARCHTDIPVCQLLARELVELGGRVRTTGHQTRPKKEHAGLVEGACPRGISSPSYPTSLGVAELLCTDSALNTMEQPCVLRHCAGSREAPLGLACPCR